MIKITIKNLNDIQFQQALGKLVHFSGFPAKTAYSIGKIATRVAQETKEARELYRKIMLNYAEVDAAGNVVKDGDAGKFKFKEGKKEADFAKEVDGLMEVEISIDRAQLSFSEIEKVGLSASDMVACEPLIDESSLLSTPGLPDLAPVAKLSSVPATH